MPIHMDVETRRLDQATFGKIAHDVMRCVFDIHNEFGRFFDEKIYKRELSRRFPNTQLEVPMKLDFESFSKLFYLDVLVGGGAVFEFKTVELLVGRHRSQLLHYLMMAELPHGKLINMRTEQVRHEFVNTKLRLSDRTNFAVTADGWQELGERPLREWCEAFLRDVGVGLDNSLYEEALTHLLGGEERVMQEIEIVSGGASLGTQKFRLAGPNVAFKITAFADASELFEVHARRLLDHTSLQAVQWINVARHEVSFRTINK